MKLKKLIYAYFFSRNVNEKFRNHLKYLLLYYSLSCNDDSFGRVSSRIVLIHNQHS